MKLLLLSLSLIFSVGLLRGQGTVTIDGNIGDWPDELIRDDPQGCDDHPGQLDVILAGAALDNMNTDILYLLFFFDEEGLSGMNTADGCWLFDMDSNGNADQAFCFTLRNNPFTLAGADVRFYTCNDSQPDRCAGAVEIAVASLNCALHAQAPELAGHACGNGNGSGVECSVDVNDIGWVSGAMVLASCSFPSQIPNSAPSDCVSSLDNPIFIVDPDTGSVPVTLQQFIIED